MLRIPSCLLLCTPNALVAYVVHLPMYDNIISHLIHLTQQLLVAPQTQISIHLAQRAKPNPTAFLPKSYTVYQRRSAESPIIHKGPMGAGMSMPVKDEMQVPPALRT